MNNPTPRHAVTFHEDGHLYMHKGVYYPSQTQIISAEFPYTGSDREILRWRGVYRHDANVAIVDGDLDFDAVPEDMKGGVEALLKFHADYGPNVIACELPLVHPAWGYACTPDMIVRTMKSRVGVAPVEIKSSWMETVRIQLGAQAIAWDENFEAMRISSDVGYCLSIRDDGTYRLFEHDLNEGRADFAALLRIQQLKARRNGR